MNIPGPTHSVDGFGSVSGLGVQKPNGVLFSCRPKCFICWAVLLLAGLPFVPRALAQPFTVDWFTVASGSGTSTGSVYAISGTAGQYDAGRLAGGAYTVDGGFWGIIAAVQAAGAPLLTITHSGPNVVVSWPSPSTGFVLEQNTNLQNPSGWSSFAGTINDGVITKSVVITSPIRDLFFRLKR